MSYLKLLPSPQMTSPPTILKSFSCFPKEEKVTFFFLESSIWASRDSFKVTFKLFLSPSEKGEREVLVLHRKPVAGSDIHAREVGNNDPHLPSSRACSKEEMAEHSLQTPKPAKAIRCEGTKEGFFGL